MMPSEPMRLCGLNLRPLRVPAFTSLLECYRYGPWIYYSLYFYYMFTSLDFFVYISLFLYFIICFRISAVSPSFQTTLVSSFRCDQGEHQRNMYQHDEALFQGKGNLNLINLQICITLANLLNKLLAFYLDVVVNTLSIFQPNSEQLEKQVEKRKVALEEARLKAKGLNPSVTPALAAFGGFSPASKPCKFWFAFSYAGYTLHDFLNPWNAVLHITQQIDNKRSHITQHLNQKNH